jgi:hypothetical protein
MKNLKSMKRFVLLSLMTFVYFGMSRAATTEAEDSLEIAEITALQIDKGVFGTFDETRELSGLTFTYEGGKDSVATSASSSMSIEKAVFCTEIDNREPVGVASSFSANTDRVYLHSSVRLPKGETATIQHVWKRDGNTISTVDLEVRGPRWRTRSYKTAPASGNWTVDIVAGGNVLESVSFTIK